MNHLYAKGVILGNSGVGKSTFLSNYAGLKKRDDNSTLNPNYFTFFLNNEISFRIYDTAGQERYSEISIKYIRGSQIIFFMTSCNEESQETDDNRLKAILESVKEQMSTPFIPIFLLNKIDLIDFKLEDPIDENIKLKTRIEEVKKIINDSGLPYIEPLFFYITSCQTISEKRLIRHTLWPLTNLSTI